MGEHQLRVREELPDPFGAGALARMWPDLLNLRQKRLVAAQKAFEGHRAREVGDLGQPLRSSDGECPHRAHCLGAVHQRQALLGAQHHRRQARQSQRPRGRMSLLSIPGLPLPDQRQRQVGQRSQISRRAHAPPLRDHGYHPAIEHLHRQLQGWELDARVPLGQHVDPKQQQRARLRQRERCSNPGSVGKQQVSLQLAQVALVDADLGQGSEPGVDPVDRLIPLGDRVHQAARANHPLDRRRGQLHLGSAEGDLEDLLQLERFTVDHDAGLSHGELLSMVAVPICGGFSKVALIVQKYGGTSVGDIERIQNVARRCMATQGAGNDVVVVVSAMSGETNRLLKLVSQISKRPSEREQDVVVATGEQVSIGLVALAIQEQGGKATSFLAHQCRMVTDSTFSKARIKSIDAETIFAVLRKRHIAVVAGFQGIDDEGNVTTLGRGGSDTTAVAIAAAIKADACEIYTDVDGVYTTDPNISPAARKLEKISYEEMLELASLGAKVLQLRSVEFGMNYRVPIHVRSSFSDAEGTWVVGEEAFMEQVVVSGVTVARDEAKITVRNLPDVAGVAFKLFTPLSEAGIVVDMIIQNTSVHGHTDMTFTVPRGERKRATEFLAERVPDLTEGGRAVSWDDG